MTELVTDHESRFTRYRPLAKLGQGGMARVFLAIASGPIGFNKLVVIKEILDELADDPEFVAMFLDEARLAARLNHPNVVQTMEVGVEGRRYFICMEYLEGQPLNRVFGRVRAKLTRGMMVRMLVETLNGLHHAHEVTDLDGTPLEVVHRDATPHNVFLTYSGQVKVVDFGIAKATSSSIKTATGVLKGKVNYMAPEQAQGEKVDRRADIYSVGMMLWDVLAGQRPFHGLPEVAIIHKIMLGEIPSPRTVAPDVPASLEAICMKALAFERDDRFATAAEMATALEQAVDALGDKGSVRDAGNVVAAQFAEEREDMKRLIETQVALIQRGSDRAPPVRTSVPPVDRSEVTVREPAVAVLSAPSADLAGEERPASSITATFSGRSQAPPPPSSPSRSRSSSIALVAAAVLGTVMVGTFVTLKSATKPAAPPVVPAPSAVAIPAKHTVAIDSTPQGATVSEGGAVLGTTPMTLELDVTSTTPRKFVMSLDGYAPHTFIPLADDVRLQFPLAPLPAAPATAPPPASATPPAKPVAPTARPRPPAAPDDIKMTR